MKRLFGIAAATSSFLLSPEAVMAQAPTAEECAPIYDNAETSSPSAELPIVIDEYKAEHGVEVYVQIIRDGAEEGITGVDGDREGNQVVEEQSEAYLNELQAQCAWGRKLVGIVVTTDTRKAWVVPSTDAKADFPADTVTEASEALLADLANQETSIQSDVVTLLDTLEPEGQTTPSDSENNSNDVTGWVIGLSSLTAALLTGGLGAYGVHRRNERTRREQERRRRQLASERQPRPSTYTSPKPRPKSTSSGSSSGKSSSSSSPSRRSSSGSSSSSTTSTWIGGGFDSSSSSSSWSSGDSGGGGGFDGGGGGGSW